MSESKACDVCGVQFRAGYRHDCVLQGNYDMLATEYSILQFKLEKAKKVLRQIKELATYDIDNDESGNTYQIEAISRTVGKELE